MCSIFLVFWNVSIDKNLSVHLWLCPSVKMSKKNGISDRSCDLSFFEIPVYVTDKPMCTDLFPITSRDIYIHTYLYPPPI